MVGNASFLGYAAGTARGMSPGARVAAYKVCWKSGCFGSDILAGIDSAISDGVDVLSLSLGGGNAPFTRDPIAVGAFAAVQKGIFVACSAGNSGPGRATLTNNAPWIATIGAGTLDRDFPAYAILGNRQRVTGVSLYSGRGMGKKSVSLVYGKGSSNSSKMCLPGSLNPKLVKGKVVLCDRGVNARVEKGLVVKEAGGIGMILANNAASGEELVADAHLLPAVAVGLAEGNRIREYAVSSRKAMALLRFGGTVLNVRPSPVVAAFSSRGPNVVTPEILKPDMIGPGVNILAGWSGSIGPTGLANDHRRTDFNIMSGTSMSCPHISGLAALLKAAHPEWSPSAIKSALMTTSYTVDNTGSALRDAAGAGLATPFSYGAGHVNPQRALSPGLVYDCTPQDYIAFLCSVGTTNEQVQAISKNPNSTCAHKLSNPGNLNYPSFSVVFSGRRTRVKYARELTNVGAAGSVYGLNYSVPDGVSMLVRPKTLVFKNTGSKLKYSATFSLKKGAAKGEKFGWIEWSNRDHRVRSPVAFTLRAAR